MALGALHTLARLDKVGPFVILFGYARPYLNWIEERSTKPNVAGSSPAGRSRIDFSPVVVEAPLAPEGTMPFGDVAMVKVKRVATLVDWLFAPEWLTVDEACFLSGWDEASMLEIIDEGGVDLNNAELIEKRSLLEFQEACALVAHWDD